VSIAGVVSAILMYYGWLIVIYVLMSWIPMEGGGTIYEIHRALGNITEPYLGLFRRFIPPIGMVDISPLVAYFVLNVIRSLIVTVLGRI
jgi:uncharacterized protein YggT (Ycf19 family)